MIEITLKGFSEEQIKGLAIQEGWREMIMTTTESPNYEIPNPETALKYLDRTKLQPIRDAIAKYRLAEAKQLRDAVIAGAEIDFDMAKEADAEYVENLISVIVEPVV